MSQRTGTHDPGTESGDEDVDDLQARQPERRQGMRPHQAAGQLADDGGTSPDEPEFGLIGDDDLGAADLGPAAPNFTDPDAPSGGIRK
jgi:hypothetical protein